MLQQLEHPGQRDVSVNDAFRPVSRFFDRIWRPEQLPSALLAAMRVLTDPAETGAVTIALPQDVQARGASTGRDELFAAARLARAPPGARAAALARAAAVIRSAPRPLIVAGGGVIYCGGHGRAARVRRGGRASRSARPRPARARCPTTTRSRLGAIGATGTAAANALAAEADVVIGIGTRYSDFTTASRTAFGDPQACGSSTSTSPPFDAVQARRRRRWSRTPGRR